MSIDNSILKILNMEHEIFIEKRKIKGKRSLVYKEYLKNNFKYCL